ncbi:MAG: FAD-dependent thymidylate synthase [Acidimicrobiales bacterium]
MSDGAPTYRVEEWTEAEAAVLRRYFTNLTGPVFALVNLPEVVKGALFARYSRSSKSLRRLFLDEFADHLDPDPTSSPSPSTPTQRAGGGDVGLARAQDLYQRVFHEYGDDSVAQLGGVHLACEQVSNLLSKILEWGRLMSYLEQSTRYIAYDDRPGGRFRYHRDPELVASPLGPRYQAEMDAIFTTYTQLIPPTIADLTRRFPPAPGEQPGVHRRAIRARALDALRGLLPAGTQSNLGIYGSGQAYEALLLRMRADPLPEARAYADLMLPELRQVIPSFLTRVDRPDRGVAHSSYLAATRQNSARWAAGAGLDRPDGVDPQRLDPERLDPERLDSERLDPERIGPGEVGPGRIDPGEKELRRPGPGGSRFGGAEVSLSRFDPQAEDDLLVAILYPHSHRSEESLARQVATMSAQDRTRLLAAWTGERGNRRHRPGRALELVSYRFDIVSDYGAFRDLQRHRMLTIQWQTLSPWHGFDVPPDVSIAGVEAQYRRAMERSGDLYRDLVGSFGPQAPYALALGYRIRYSMHLNAREAMHMLELRTTPAAHPSYRAICVEMHRQIAEVAGHRAIAAMMSFVGPITDGQGSAEVGRLDSERRAFERRGAVVADAGPGLTLN